MNDLTIAHLSDLHLSTETARDAFEFVADDLKNLPTTPKLLIVSGDLVDNPRSTKLRLAQKLLLKLCDECKIDHLFVVPGNHDYRWRGNFGFWKGRDSFNQIFADCYLSKLITVSDKPVVVFCLDSNNNNPLCNSARGAVGDKEYKKFSREYSSLRQKHAAEFEQAYKIVVLHHHPLPIADTEVSGITNKDAFHALDDAGTFMREMVKNRIDLILHGHKHNPMFARIKFETPTGEEQKREEREICVLGAGSATQFGPGGSNSYNLIRLKAHGEVEIEQRDRRTGTFEYFRQTTVQPYESVRERSYEIARRNQDYRFNSVAGHLLMNDSGDGKFQMELQDLTVRKTAPPLDFMPFDRRTTTGTFDGVQVSSLTRDLPDPRWVPGKETSNQRLTGEIHFISPINDFSDPFSFGIAWKNLNGFALTTEQHQRMYGNEDAEYFSLHVRKPMKRLFLTVHFPPGIVPDSFDVIVTDKDRIPHHREKEWCRAYLHSSKLTGTVTLAVSKPLIDCRYGIAWTLPSESAVGLKFLAQIEGNAKAICEELLKLKQRGAESDLETNPLHQILEKTRNEILSKYGDPDKNLEISLMVYDHTINRLRAVAGIFRPSYWNWELREGEGIAGRAYKTRRAIMYVESRKREDPELGVYIHPEGATPHSVVLSVPLFYPLSGKAGKAGKGPILGVLSLASTSSASRLLGLWDNEKIKNAQAQYLSEDVFLRTVLPALGLDNLLDAGRY